MGRPSKIPEIERRFGRPIEDILNDLVDQGESPQGIADALRISQSMAYELIKQFDLKSKLKSRAKSDFQSYFGNSEGEFTRLIDDFITAKEIGGKTNSTIRFYKTNLMRYVWWLNERGIPLQIRYCFTTEVIRHFLHYVQTTPERFGGRSTSSRKPVSRSTVDAYWRTFQAFSTWLVREGKLKESPIGYGRLKKIEKPKQVKLVVPEIPDEVIAAMLNSCDDSLRGRRDKTIILILLDTGIRLGELVGIELKDMNLEAGLIKVFGKGQKERIVRISGPTREAIERYLELRAEVAKTDRLLVNDYGYALGPSGVQIMLRKFQKQFPDYPIHPHAFRHKFALEVLRGSGNLAALQMLGGWENLEMPRHYAAAIQQEDALKVHEAASPVEKLMEVNGNGGKEKATISA
ncbi:MAG TPA: tyrosine-type recombinase/integrase [Dehalococcoidia bacterium]|nr:tyrosine-type recombinase/integrase [Dehalococcoidia bacterium]